MRTRYLIVEDDPTMMESLKTALSGKFDDIDIVTSTFNDAPAKVEAVLPDAVILDLCENQLEDDTAVKPTWTLIIEKHFCPVVIHSAHELEGYCDFAHPYVRFERKETTSIARVLAHLEQFQTQIVEFYRLRTDFTKRAGEALRDTSKLLASKDRLSKEQESVVLRTARRRVVASFDYPEEHAHAWERYIYPVLGPHLLMGDILHEVTKPKENPDSFWIVLTPSCDLVPNRPGSSIDVLIAGCAPVASFVKAVGLAGSWNDDKKVKLGKELNRDQVAGFTAFPGIPGIFPTMCVNLRKLALLPVVKAGIYTTGGEITHHRVASLDSPFREKLGWAFLQIAGRPATPDFNLSSLVDEIARLCPPVTPTATH